MQIKLGHFLCKAAVKNIKTHLIDDGDFSKLENEKGERFAYKTALQYFSNFQQAVLQKSSNQLNTKDALLNSIENFYLK